MVRPTKPRRIIFNPDVTYFKPRAVPLSAEMKISQSTLQRILSSARKKIAEALIEGKAIKIQSNKKSY